MRLFNPDTGQYEALDFSGFLSELKQRSQILESTQSVEEAFVAGGDFQDMAESQKRKREDLRKKKALKKEAA